MVKGKVLGLKWRESSQIERGKVARDRGEVWGMMARDDQSCFRDKRRISRETRAWRACLRGAKIGGKDGAFV